MRVKSYRLRTFERYALALADKCFDLEDLGYLPMAEKTDGRDDWIEYQAGGNAGLRTLREPSP